MILDICVHNAHVVNTVSTIMTEVMDQEVTLLLRGLYRRRLFCDSCAFGPRQIFLWTLHGATCEDEGVIVHMRGGEIFSGQVCNPLTDLIVTRRDKAALLTVEGLAYSKGGVAAVTLTGEVWGI